MCCYLWRFFHTQSPVNGGIAPFFKLGWTLNYEMYFYVLFAVLLIVRPVRRRVLLLVGYALMVSTFFVLVDPRIAVVRVYTNPMIFEFVMGAVVGYLFINGYFRRLSVPAAAAVVGLALVILIAFPPPDADLARSLLQGGAAAALLGGMLGIEASGKLPRVGWMVLLGNASYSIYLMHPLVESFMRVSTKLLQVPVQSMWIGAPLVFFSTLGSVMLGIASYRFVELPLLAHFKQIWQRGVGFRAAEMGPAPENRTVA